MPQTHEVMPSPHEHTPRRHDLVPRARDVSPRDHVGARRGLVHVARRFSDAAPMKEVFASPPDDAPMGAVVGGVAPLPQGADA